MFLERQKFDVRESVFDCVVSKEWRDLAISQRTIVLFRDSPPRAKMHFVDRKWFAPRLSLLSSRHPCTIAKLVFRFEYDRRSFRRDFHHEGIRIGFEKLAPARIDLVLIQLTGLQSRNKKLPDAAVATTAHPMLRGIPTVEVANDADAPRVRRPHGECDAAISFVRDQMRAKLFVDAFVLAFAKEMQVKFAKYG